MEIKHEPLVAQQVFNQCSLSYLDLHLGGYTSKLIGLPLINLLSLFAIVVLLGMSEDSWSLVCNYLHKELTKWSNEYINLIGGINTFEELK